MSKYQPLIARAVAGLTDPTALSRHDVYQRAELALVAQLRRSDHGLTEAKIADEVALLREAAALVETQLRGGASHAKEVTASTAPAERSRPVADEPRQELLGVGGKTRLTIRNRSDVPKKRETESPNPGKTPRSIWLVAGAAALGLMAVAFTAWSLSRNAERLSPVSPDPRSAHENNAPLRF